MPSSIVIDEPSTVPSSAQRPAAGANRSGSVALGAGPVTTRSVRIDRLAATWHLGSSHGLRSVRAESHRRPAPRQPAHGPAGLVVRPGRGQRVPRPHGGPRSLAGHRRPRAPPARRPLGARPRLGRRGRPPERALRPLRGRHRRARRRRTHLPLLLLPPGDPRGDRRTPRRRGARRGLSGDVPEPDGSRALGAIGRVGPPPCACAVPGPPSRSSTTCSGRSLRWSTTSS